jgi:urease accessory protein
VRRGAKTGLLFLFVACAFAAAEAAAHVVAPGTPLSAILHHPAFAPVHALGLMGAGLWAGQQADRTGWVMIGALLAGVVLGIALGRIGWLPPWRTPVLFAGIGVLGAATALRWRPPAAIGAAIAAAVGLYQGVVGTIPEFMGGSGHNAPPDIAVAALVLGVLGREISVRARPPWARIVVRIAGSWIAAAAILLLAFSFRIQFGLGAGPRG